MANDKTILVTGATGKQGGAVARQLPQRGLRVRAMTRKPDSDAREALAALGAEVVEGDLDDAASLERALRRRVGRVRGAEHLGGGRREGRGAGQAPRQARARARASQHFVYTSVGSAAPQDRHPALRQQVARRGDRRALEVPVARDPAAGVLHGEPAAPWFLQGDKLVTAMKPDDEAADGRGRGHRPARRARVQTRTRCNGAEIDFAGDAVTMPRRPRRSAEAMGKPITFEQIPIERCAQNSEDMALMLEWFERVGYNADIASQESRWGIGPTTSSSGFAPRRAERGAARRRLRQHDRPAVRFS